MKLQKRKSKNTYLINFIDIDQLPMGNIGFRLIELYNLEAYIKKFKENKN